MKKLLLLFFLLYSFSSLLAQNNIPEFGKVDISELTMKECPFEKNADAMNLVQTAKVDFDTRVGGAVPETTLEYRYRIKIFNERGFSSANIKIPYFSESKSSKVTDIEGYIYNLDTDGNIVIEKLEKKDLLILLILTMMLLVDLQLFASTTTRILFSFSIRKT